VWLREASDDHVRLANACLRHSKGQAVGLSVPVVSFVPKMRICGRGGLELSKADETADSGQRGLITLVSQPEPPGSDGPAVKE
jgi:hypothetical protein